MTINLMMRDEELTFSTRDDHEGCLDRLHVMSALASGRYSYPPRPPTAVIRDEDRIVFCDSFYKLVDTIGMDREVVSTTWSFIDRMLAAHPTFPRRLFSLLAVSSLHLAIKMRHGNAMSLEDMSKYTNNKHSPEQIRDVEAMLIRTLKWMIHPPSVRAVLNEVFQLLVPRMHPAGLGHLADFSVYLADLCVYTHDTARRRPAETAVACISVALEWIPDALAGDSSHEVLTFVANILEVDAFSPESQTPCVRREMLAVYEQTVERQAHAENEEDGDEEGDERGEQSNKRQRRSPVNVATYQHDQEGLIMTRPCNLEHVESS